MNEINIIRGTTFEVSVTIYTDDGDLYEIQTDDKLIFGVKLNEEDTEYELEKIITSQNKQGDGYIISLKPEDTAELEFKKYKYDVGLQTSDGNFYMIIPCSDFNIRKAITAKEAAQ